MEAVRLFHLVARWLLILIEAGGLLWLSALSLALLGWIAWGVSSVLGQVRQPAAQARAALRENRSPARR